MSAYRTDFNETKYMFVFFLTKDDDLSEKYIETSEKATNNIKKGFDSEPVHNENYLKTKIKSCERKLTQIFTVIKC